jgi:indolepyruvate decarboxylase
MPKKSASFTIGTYLIERLYDLGVRHIFGVPGDFTLKFCKLLERQNKIRFIGTTREDTAGFAADGYARKRDKGVGVVLVTHGVGALSTVNPIAGAYAESSPVIVISGAPGLSERKNTQLIHHSFGPPGAQLKIFENFTCRAVALDDLPNAARQIDLVVESVWRQKKPGYIELPRDMVDKKIVPYQGADDPFCQFAASDEETLKETIAETAAWLQRAERPAILAGVELHRFGAQEDLLRLLDATRLPVAATIMGKSVISERHPCYVGVYQGAAGSDATRRWIEDADLLLTLGVMFTDVNMGMNTARIDLNRTIRANQGEVAVKHHKFPVVMLKDFLVGLVREVKARGIKPRTPPQIAKNETSAPGKQAKNAKLTMAALIQILNRKITPDMAIVCDTGDCLFASAELNIPEKTAFFASAFYTTMGFAVPAALGINCASPESRMLILVGDGAFQMTGTELATFKKLDFAPIVVIINNGGYATERVILEGKYNDIPNWNYEDVCRLVNSGVGLRVETPAQLETALDTAILDKSRMYVLNAIVTETSAGMRRLAGEIGRSLRDPSGK